jgi:hypothetical protein
MLLFLNSSKKKQQFLKMVLGYLFKNANKMTYCLKYSKVYSPKMSDFALVTKAFYNHFTISIKDLYHLNSVFYDFHSEIK